MATILVVDDDSTIRELVAHWLSTSGHNVVTAKNAAEGLACTLATHFDVVLTDVRMPRDSGIDLLRYVEKYRPGVRVLLMSGDATAARESVPVLLKPFTREQLAQRVSDDSRPGQSSSR